MEYNIYIPSGNPTALVKGLIEDKEKRKQINDDIMLKHDIVEQVGFISDNKHELMMAGLEFCGNATRSATYYYLDGNPGEIEIKVTGVKNKLKSGIDNNGNVWVSMPIIKGNYKNSIKIINNKMAIVKMYGITHLVAEYDVKGNIKEEALKLLRQYDLLKYEASGVMFINEKNILNPVVYVRDINTLFYETACGSGTTAVAIYKSFNYRKDINLNIIQPSKEVINVKTKTDMNNIFEVIISGKVDLFASNLTIN